MAEELRKLSACLERVIIVTHQEEMFNQFHHTYRITKVDGACRQAELRA